MKYAADIIGEFSRKTGIKDKKLDVMLQQQKERKVLWLPQPDSLDEWNFDTMTHTTIGVDVGTNEPPSVFFGAWTFDEPTREQRRFHRERDFTEAFKAGFDRHSGREYYDRMKYKTRRDEERRWYVMTGISKWGDDEEVVDAEWRDVTDVKALPEG
jgi:hypothetical protein